MNPEEAKKIIKDSLEKMGAEDITFAVSEEGRIEVAFNSKEITSFVTDIKGWNYSGIQLDSSGKHQYKISFTKS